MIVRSLFDHMAKHFIFKVFRSFLSYVKDICLFLARDADERQKWISNLEEAISLNSVNTVWIFF